MERSVEKPGRPCQSAAKAVNVAREDITEQRPGRESERPIVAEKRVTTVEQRGLTEDMFV